MDNAHDTAWLAALMNGEGASAPGFAPIAQYYPEMDFLLYLNEDCSYRADRVDAYLTLLLHPYEQRAVGIKLKGFRFIFDRVRHIHGLRREDFMPVTTAIEVALAAGYAEALINKVAPERLEQSYAQARQLARTAKLPVTTELLQAA